MRYKTLSTLLRSSALFAVCLAAVGFLAPRAHAQEVPVENPDDNGNKSFRWAIQEVNAGRGNRIVFKIPGNGPHVITIRFRLPILEKKVEIDGRTQQGYAGTPVIVLNYNPQDRAALLVQANDCKIRALHIRGSLFRPAIHVNNVQGCEITGCILGKAKRLNDNSLGNDIGILLEGNNCLSNTIGGTASGARNIISGNKWGIRMTNGANDNKVYGNFIGIGIDGSAVGNDIGVYLDSGPGNKVGGSNLGEGNVISNSQFTGVDLARNGRSNIVQGNLIGTDFSGTVGMPNGLHGIGIEGGADHLIGGSTPGARNIISSNRQHGISVSFASGVQIQGNYIGTNIGGNRITRDSIGRVGNGKSGIRLLDAPGTDIGGFNAAQGNVISGNRESGIDITYVNAQGNEQRINIQNNRIGTDYTGKTIVGIDGEPMGNIGDGVSISGAANVFVGNLLSFEQGFNVIGGNQKWGVSITGNQGKTNTVMFNYIGLDATKTRKLPNKLGGVKHADGAKASQVDKNVIGFNLGPGVRVENALACTISQNEIFDNLGKGIEFFGFANNGQAAPVLTLAVPSNGGSVLPGQGTLVRGFVTSSFAESAYPLTIEFFDNDVPDSSGYGEGKRYLGAITMQAPGEFVITLVYANILTATATDSAGNTSEFSNALMVAPLTPP